ncbi:ATP-binding protein [Spirillospora sp. CA-255316]
MSEQSNKYRIVSPELTVKAMRDSGYKDTAHAIAELIDNSIDAEADLVEVFACEAPVQLKTRVSYRVAKIAVLDNGHGMDTETLRRSLKYGDGSGNGDSGEPRIGKFGMGLPNSSLSQCTQVEVWSWTNGPGNALYTLLNLEQIRKGQEDVPDPEHIPVPEYWRKLSSGLGKSGTLVLWTDLDRVNWYGAAATLRHTEELIGRIYRKFLNTGRVQIRMAPVRDDQVIEADEYYATPNDPLYLMKETCTPPPFDMKPMFQAFELGDPERPGVQSFQIADKDGVRHTVMVRAAMARPEARLRDIPGHPWPEDAKSNKDAGHQKWGKHAERNVGISLVREDRELLLDSAWANSDVRERWWGIEVSFPEALDDVFGVTNNKQSATVFESLARLNWEAELEEGESFKAYKDRLRELGDPRLPLIDLANHIETSLLRPMRAKIKAQRHGARGDSGERYPDKATQQATNAIKKRQEEGHTTKEDLASRSQSEDEKRNEQVDNLIKRHHVAPEAATKIVDHSLKLGLLANWIASPQDTEAFFTIDPMTSILQVAFNSDHVLHDRLMTVMEEVPNESSTEDLRERLAQVATTFQLLLFSWARMEKETSDPEHLKMIKGARRDWGSYAHDFIEDGDF